MNLKSSSEASRSKKGAACINCTVKHIKCSVQPCWTDGTPIQGKMGNLLARRFHCIQSERIKNGRVVQGLAPLPQQINVEWQAVCKAQFKKAPKSRQIINKEYFNAPKATSGSTRPPRKSTAQTPKPKPAPRKLKSAEKDEEEGEEDEEDEDGEQPLSIKMESY